MPPSPSRRITVNPAITAPRGIVMDSPRVRRQRRTAAVASRIMANEAPTWHQVRDAGSEGGAAVAGAEFGDVVVGGAGGLGAVSDRTQVPGRGEPALEG